MPDPDQIAELQARADAGDRNAAGRLGELLARRGDLEGAVRVWAQAYGDDSPTTRRLGELLARRGDLEGAVRAWQFSDVVRQNPAGLHAEFLSTLSREERLDWDDEPEDWAFMESEELARLLAEQGDGQRRYVASWAEHKLPGNQGRAITWGPKPFEQAKAALIAELRRNLSTWAGWGGSDPVRYSQALDTLKTASGPVTIDLPGHILIITEAAAVSWIAPDVGRSEDYPARRNEPEREMLRDWLDWHRATLLRKCAGLDAVQLATRAVPPSSLCLLGLVRHMADAERGWVRQTFRGEQVPDLYYRSDAPDADFEEADPAGAEEDLELYRAECRAVDAALEGAKLDDTFTFREKTTSVRWMWQHLVEEYARHNGHADLLREAIDGSAGM